MKALLELLLLLFDILPNVINLDCLIFIPVKPTAHQVSGYAHYHRGPKKHIQKHHDLLRGLCHLLKQKERNRQFRGPKKNEVEKEPPQWRSKAHNGTIDRVRDSLVRGPNGKAVVDILGSAHSQLDLFG